MVREEAITVLKNLVIPPFRKDGKSTWHLMVNMAIQMAIDALEAEPIKHGYWDGDTCSVCGFSWCDVTYEAPQTEMSFCPNCGANMDDTPTKKVDTPTENANRPTNEVEE